MRVVTTIVLLTGLAALLAGCGDSGASAAPGPSFPVRVLEERARPPDAENALFEDELDSPEGWLAVVDGPDHLPRLSPAAALVQSGVLGWDAGRVRMPAGSALLHRVTLKGPMQHSLTARLRAPGASVGAPCNNLLLMPAISGSGRELLDRENADPLKLMELAQACVSGQALDDVPGEVDVGANAAWREAADSDGFALARWLGWMPVDAPRGPDKWIVLLAADAPLEVDRVRLAVAPTLHFGSDASTTLPAGTADAVVDRVRIGGDSRIAALVPPGEALSLALDVPPNAVDVVLGTCPDPAAMSAMKPGERRRTTWSLRVQPGNRLIAQLDEVVTAQRGASFTNLVLPWPSGVQGPCTLEFLVAGRVGMVFGQPRVRGPEAPGKPSLLLISIDTLRADQVGAFGCERPTTPFLDHLASRGCAFTDVTAVSSYTLPTHSSLFTGCFPPRHLVLDTFDRLNSARTPTLAQRLSEAGFHTAAFTGGGFMSGDYGFDAGFDRYVTIDPLAPQPGAPDGSMAAVTEWIRRVGRRSWFAFVHTYAVHDYLASPADLTAFERGPAPTSFDPYELLDQRDVRATPPTTAELDRLVDLYDGALRGVDRRLRIALAPLLAEGLLDETWIVVTSDHGEEFLEHGQLRHRGSLYQELLHVPLIIVPPSSSGLAAGLRVQDAVSQVDVCQTLLDLLGQPVPEGLDGRSLAPYLRGGRPAGPPTPLFSHIDRTMVGRTMLRAGSWKLVHSDTSGKRTDPVAQEWELYDLLHDPGERQDLSGSADEPLAALRAHLEQVEAALGSHGGERTQFQPDQALQERLAQLGYAEGKR